MEFEPIPPQPRRNRYVVRMLDGRELVLDSDFSLNRAMSEAREDVSEMRSWFVIGQSFSRLALSPTDTKEG